MKKILLAILAMSVVSVANATTTSSNLTLNGSVVSSCTSVTIQAVHKINVYRLFH